jgi:urease subunit alpha
VVWKPSFFGVKPELVLKGGYAAWAPLGDGNSTVERAEPTRYRGDWGTSAGLAAHLGVTFCAPGMSGAVSKRLISSRPVVEIGPTRGLIRKDLLLNRATAAIDVDPGDGAVTLDGRVLAVAPATDLPLNRRYLLR